MTDSQIRQVLKQTHPDYSDAKLDQLVAEVQASVDVTYKELHGQLPPGPYVSPSRSMSLETRTEDICGQLTRYSNCVTSHLVADILDELVDINDDLVHGRDSSVVRPHLEEAQRLLTILGREIDAR